MATSFSVPGPFTKEQVFTNSTIDQAKEYQAARGSAYPPAIYQHIVAFNKANGGQTHRAVDLGCGPGNATRDLLTYFEDVTGLDDSRSMIETANDLIPATARDRLRFYNLPAEEVDKIPNVEPGSIDVITAATAAHWFDLPATYQAAFRALKPGGTIAFFVHRMPTPRADQPHRDEILAIIKEMDEQVRPYCQIIATTLSREKVERINGGSSLEHLPLPWTVDPPVAGFDQQSFQRTVFCDENGNQALPNFTMTISQAERAYGCTSPVIRWREQHPELVGTDQDVVKSHFNRIRKILGADDAEMYVNMRFIVLTWKVQLREKAGCAASKYPD